MNRFSLLLLPPNSPDRSSPCDMDMMSNAFTAGARNASARSGWPSRRPSSCESRLRERLTNHGCVAARASTETRVAGFGSSRRCTRRRAGGDTHGGTSYSRRCAFRHISGMFASSKGRRPARRTKSMTPQDHASALAPSYDVWRSTSGAA
uniref:Uncharacterized protein n=1 Tax=Triticum urartu TaxID=4572 RepID=A0A8R7UBS6_TRIUA